MNAVYEYLIEMVPQKSHESVSTALLFSLMAIEECLVKHSDEHLKEVYEVAVQGYARTNGWIAYRKKTIAHALNLTVSQVTRQIRDLKEQGYVKIHTFSIDTFIEICIWPNMETL